MMAFSFLIFVAGLVIGVGLAYSKMSFVRKQHLKWMEERNNEMAELDQQELVKYQKSFDQALLTYRDKLNKLMLEEQLIRAEFPVDDEVN